jgi:hypothetical protein
VGYNVYVTTRFRKEAEKIIRVYPSFKADIDRLIDSLSLSPNQGDHLGQGIFKIRIPISGKAAGKSYGARTIHAVFSAREAVYLITVYDKSNKRDLESSELKEIIRMIKELRKT